MHENNKIRNPHDPFDIEKKEARDREILQIVQSQCAHRRAGVISEDGHNVLYCKDCRKIIYGEDI